MQVFFYDDETGGLRPSSSSSATVERPNWSDQRLCLVVPIKKLSKPQNVGCTTADNRLLGSIVVVFFRSGSNGGDVSFFLISECCCRLGVGFRHGQNSNMMRLQLSVWRRTVRSTVVFAVSVIAALFADQCPSSFAFRIDSKKKSIWIVIGDVVVAAVEIFDIDERMLLSA
ncbi:hypothetical protein ACLOJK_027383 [Asimina triloba]